MTLDNQFKTEILCIGTELLLGNIVNSNARWIAEELSSLGLPHFQQTVIGDNKGRLEKVILEISKRSRFIITTGGLGPTPDDLTTESIACAFKTEIVEREGIWDDIQNKITSKGNKASLINKKQAFFPAQAQIIQNPTGTAPGMIWSPKEDFTVITLPGVPDELKAMWAQTVKPWFKNNLNNKEKYFSRMMKFSGVSESKLSEIVDDLFVSKNPTVAPYASLGEVKLRLTAKASSLDEANKILSPVQDSLIKRTGLHFYGFDNQSLSSVVIDLLRDNNETISVAESCTGGGLGAELTAIAGSSDVFMGGIIAYKNSIKENLLDIPKQIILSYGAVSEEVAKSMAESCRKLFQSDWAIGVSGIAGPAGGTKNKPVGLVHIAISGPNGTFSNKEIFNACKGRRNIQKLSVVCSLNRLRLLLLARG